MAQLTESSAHKIIASLTPPAAVTRLRLSEERAILSNPYGLRLLMDREDERFAQYESQCAPIESGPWPTPHYLALREMGRKIIAEDPELWPAELHSIFGFEA